MEQMERKLKDGVQGEELNVLVGSIPYDSGEVSERVKLNFDHPDSYDVESDCQSDSGTYKNEDLSGQRCNGR